MRDDGRKFVGMPAWLRQTISRSDAVARLNDVQANILRPHSQARVLHAFVTFDRQCRKDVLDWMSKFAEYHMPSCASQLSGTATSSPFGNLYLSASGYRMLGLEPPNHRSFRGGMKEANLNDPPLAEWDEAFRENLDAMVSLGGKEEDVPRARATLETLRGGCRVFWIEEGTELPGGVEHFGFMDGISQPIFVEEDLRPGESWSAATPLQVVLARDPYGAGDYSYGTYVVFRKLRQDVARFELGVREMAVALGVSEELAGAMVIGRFKDGTPLALASRPSMGPVNDFGYAQDTAGVKCPFASHVRHSNPRGELDAVAHAPDWQTRIARRGLPYGRPGDAEVGLLFICYQSDIAAQFEVIQNNWCNFPHFPVLRIGRDPLVGQKNSWDHFEGQRWPDAGSRDGFRTFGFPQCVTMRGGEYFFAPSIGFLKNIGDRVAASKEVGECSQV